MHRQLELGLPLPQVLYGTARRLGIVDFKPGGGGPGPAPDQRVVARPFSDARL